MPQKSPPLMLMAEDEQDLQVFSAYLQDAIAQVSEMAFLPSLNRFVLAVGRFRWEDEDKSSGLLGRNLHERVETGIHFDTVLSVQRKNFPASTPDSAQKPPRSDIFLSLLALESESLENGNVAITLVFSGDSAIRLEVECIAGYLQDLDLAWKTLRRPDHRLDTAGQEPENVDTEPK